jgi:hypothetical protein
MIAVNDLPNLAMEFTAPFTFARRAFGCRRRHLQ